MQRTPGNVMANGHGEESFLDALRDWMPGIVAALALVVSWAAWVVRLVWNDRNAFKGQLDELRNDSVEMKRQITCLSQMQSYPEEPTSERLHDLEVQADKLIRSITATRKQLDRKRDNDGEP